MSYFLESIPTGPETEIIVSVPTDWQMPHLAIRHKDQTLGVALDKLEVEMLILSLRIALQESEKFP